MCPLIYLVYIELLKKFEVTFGIPLVTFGIMELVVEGGGVLVYV